MTRTAVPPGASAVHPVRFPWAAPLIDSLVRVDGDRLLYREPFFGGDVDEAAFAELVAFWRRLQNQNRDIAKTAGIRAWKRETISRFLWHDGAKAGGRRAIWPSRADAEPGDIQIEDGFIRSRGLGAELNAPLSIVVDGRGIYYDPSGPSDLEYLLEHEDIGAALRTRAAQLAARIVRADIIKYGARGEPVDLPKGRRLILVPGQVEDDRSVRLGGGPLQSNAALLAAVRNARPDACIVFKPHPDVEAGLRSGGPAPGEAAQLADIVVRDARLTSLFAAVDEVHTLTSLTGFEALLRGLPVTTYGVPFYAGWGLTEDRGAVPARRTRRRSLNELIAATLILYPRYLDPVSGLPCPPEVLVSRLEGQVPTPVTALTRIRRAQGRVTAALRKRA
ncbi:beta-3-deoxy-D-manno-oct-2-ulosonic acid transferase [Pacificimonas sp. WHA3]|uniref:Beta-3-deoxy-D-manno-oct-2-ulosonic acid transferase n=1 Tax=Pacificimonas pallii TaxID=2827236 RepID=A0ABS6SAE1_9SPHN|nr:beta-3-deoxy-D-manno-oct-2-ulosonic acid transferase [Pacificimonas pallii]MBV7255165.1 beta-3-deoxy-D-manno-oct-2-ulosonic acid transferase [Pacificimonas pallii]